VPIVSKSRSLNLLKITGSVIGLYGNCFTLPHLEVFHQNITLLYFTLYYTVLHMLYAQSIFSFDLSAVTIIPFRRIFCFFVFLFLVCNVLLSGENLAHKNV